MHISKEFPIAAHSNRSYALVAKKSSIPNQVGEWETDKPVMVIDDECLIDKNLELTLVAKVKDFKSLPNLRVVCNYEGFKDVTIRYLGLVGISRHAST